MEKWTLWQHVGEYFLGTETRKRYNSFREEVTGHFERRTNFTDMSEERKVKAMHFYNLAIDELKKMESRTVCFVDIYQQLLHLIY